MPPAYPPASSSLVLLSGAVDSATLLADTVRKGGTTEALTVHDGRRPAAVLQAAQALACHYGVRHHVVDLNGLVPLLRPRLIGHSALGDDDTDDTGDRPPASPVWHAALYAMGAAVADARGLDQVLTGVHHDDRAAGHTREAITATDLAVQLHTQGRVRLTAPYINHTRAEIATVSVHARLAGGMARSCLSPAGHYQDPHCGRCDGCRHRHGATVAAGVIDGVRYAVAPRS